MSSENKIDFRFTELENIIQLVIKAPKNQTLLTDLYNKMKQIFFFYLKDEELFNDFYLKVLRNLNNIDFNKSVKNYLITLSKNTEINNYVKKNRKKHTRLVYKESISDFEEFTNDTSEEEKEERIQREYKEDAQFFTIFNTLPIEDQDFFYSYFDIENKTGAERIRYYKIKQQILLNYKQIYEN